MPEATSDATVLLQQIRTGGDDAARKLVPLLYDELRGIAARALLRERPDHTLQATALVNEAFLRMVDSSRADWRDRQHFCRAAARVIRHVLLDHARARQADKRAGGSGAIALPLDEGLIPALHTPAIDLLVLSEALDKLEALSARQAAVVEMRFFAGMSVDETAAALDVSPRTVDGDWRFARAWLSRALSSAD